MSTSVRILILVGVLVISVVSFIICIKLSGKMDKKVKDEIRIGLYFFYGIALIMGVVLLFCYPNRVFLTIEKVGFISMILLFVDIVMIGAAIIGYGSEGKRNSNYNFIMIPISIVAIIVFLGLMRFIETNTQKYIEETNKAVVSEEIEPFITAQAKCIFVEYDENNNVVSCKYYYIEDNNLTDKEIAWDEIEDVVYLENNEDSYIEKTETSVDYINHEMKPSSDQYSYTETTEKYVLFLNKDQIAEYN